MGDTMGQNSRHRLLESDVRRKALMRRSEGAVGKVPLVGNSLAAYPTVRPVWCATKHVTVMLEWRRKGDEQRQ